MYETTRSSNIGSLRVVHEIGTFVWQAVEPNAEKTSTESPDEEALAFLENAP